MSSGLYIHIPYCLKKCPYCDFNSYATSKEEVKLNEESYINSLIKEASHSDWQEDIETIFIGGGTPSMLSEKSIENLLNGLSRTLKIKANAEITLESNPGSISEPLYADKLKSFRESGINRISLGIQSFDNEKLKFLGRIHNSKQSLSAIQNVIKAGFQNFNLDLIYAVKDETLDNWKKDLKKAIELNPNHISAYTLTIEPGTDFGRQSKKGLVHTSDENTTAELYKYTQEELERNTYSQYEVSNFSKKQKECQHNLIYWSYKNYLGLGAGAHSFKKNKRWINILKPEDYIKRIEEKNNAIQRNEELSEAQQQIEIIYSCLRKSDGLNLDKIKPNGDLSSELNREINEFIEQDMLIKHDNRLKYTKKGYLFSDYIVKRLTACI